MPIGTIMWLDNTKEKGIIRTRNGSEFLLNDNGIPSTENNNLRHGQQISFKIDIGPNGFYATSIVPIGLSPY